MGYVEGFTLGDLLRGKKLSREERLRILQEVAEAVGFAHGKGVVHRDLKPGNVLVDPNGRALLTDFGLARADDMGTRLTMSYSVMGTPHYMAPEQVEGRAKEVTARTDVYALGVMLYECLAETLPFEGTTPAALFKRILEEEARKPSLVDGTIAGDVEAICLKAMMKEPERRYADGGEMARDLGRYRNGEAVSARPPSWSYRIKKKLARRKGVVAALGAGVAAVGLLSAVLIPMWTEEKGRKEEAEERAGEMGERALRELRERTGTALRAALALRRTGAREAMKQFAEETERSCREASEAMPDRPEPHQALGRMYRAQMREAEALAEQEKAIAKDPDFAPAIYERLVLSFRRYQQRLSDLVAQARRERGERLVRDSEGDIRPRAWPSWPGEAELVAADPTASGLRSRMEKDSREVEKAGLEVSQLLCARAMRDWIEGDVENARRKLAQAVSEGGGDEEAHEALALLDVLAGRYEDAAWRLQEAWKGDRGYLHYLEGLANVYVGWAMRLDSAGEDPIGKVLAARTALDE